MEDLDNMSSLIERAEYFQNILIDRATGGAPNEIHFKILSKEMTDNESYDSLLPRWVKTCRSLSQYWQYIKNVEPTYAGRRNFIWSEFSPLLNFIESNENNPMQQSISEVLNKFDSESIVNAWQKALKRKSSDPDGAITTSRTMLESVCKHILDDVGVEYNSSSLDMSELYKLTSKELNLSPDQHNEKIFKQILGGCSGIVNGLGTLRNRLGDSHGHGKQSVKPLARHAELAVNLAGSMALFLISTYDAKKIKIETA